MKLEESKWAEVQVTKEQAIAIAESNIWKEWNSEQTVRFQLFQKRLCMDFSHFHGCVEDVLGRSVFTHEFADRDNLVLEYLGEKEIPTFNDIMNSISVEKRLLINI